MIDTIFAQGIVNPVLPPKLGGGTAASGGLAIGAIISGIVSGMFIIAFIVAFIYLITGGFHWITSSGDKANLEHARNKIIHALVGLVVVASAWAVASLAADFFCLDLQRLPIPTIGVSRPASCKKPAPTQLGGNQCGGCSGSCTLEGQFCEKLTSQCSDNKKVVEVFQCVGGTYQFQYPQAGGTCYPGSCN